MPTLKLKIKSAEGIVTLHMSDTSNAKRCRELNALYDLIRQQVISEGLQRGLSEYRISDLVKQRIRIWTCGLTPHQ